MMHLEIESTVIAAANPEGQVAFINQHVEVLSSDKDKDNYKDKDKDKDRIAHSIHNNYVSFLIIVILIFKFIIRSSLILSHKHRQGLTERDSQTRKRRTLKDRRTPYKRRPNRIITKGMGLFIIIAMIIIIVIIVIRLRSARMVCQQLGPMRTMRTGRLL